MTINRDLQNRAATLVAREVQCCMSSLVATLASGSSDRIDDSTLLNLADQALNLASPVLDYEGAAKEPDSDGLVWTDEAMRSAGYSDWQEVCADDGIDPHECEVFEHWAVSTWLADKLEAKGEKVDRDFAGLNVWARTTTGQAISMDSVIEAITTETGYASGGEA